MVILARALAGVFFVLAAVHVYWAVRGVGGGAGVPTRADGTPVMHPGPGATLLVALALALAGGIVLGRVSEVLAVLPMPWLRWATWGVAAAFAARTVGEFRYVGLFKRVRGTRFARWDTRLFTPLAAAIAAATAIIAAS